MTGDCVGYIRVSTERQVGEVYTSLADQRAAIDVLAKSLGRTVATWYEDEASGGTDDRKRFREMMAGCAADPRTARGKVPGYILVLNESRWGRFPNPEEGAYWRVHFEKLGWLVRYVENDDIREVGMRTVVRAISGAQASEYRANVRRNAARGARGTAAQGFWIWRTPYGYRRKVVYPAGRERLLQRGERKAVDEKVALVVQPDEAAIVRAIFERYGTGLESLNSLGVWAVREAPEKHWSTAALRFILTNPAYVGDVVGGRVPADRGERRATPKRAEADWYGKPGAHEPIVSRALFARVEALMARNRRATRSVRSDWVLTGIVRCRCGAAFAAGGGGGRGGRIPCYKCSTLGQLKHQRCAFPGTVTKALLESAVLGELQAVLGSKRAKDRIIRATDAVLAVVRSRPHDAVAGIAKEAKAVETRKARLVAAVEEGSVTSAEARPRLAELRAQLAALADRKAEIERDRSFAETLAGERDRLVALLLDFPKAMRRVHGHTLRELIRPWVRSAVFNTETRVLTIEVRHLPAVLSGDFGRMLSRPAQKGDTPEPVTVRHVVVGRGRR